MPYAQASRRRIQVQFRTRFRGCGFTIPEVLVVIGIIAVLMALLLPAFAGTRRTAQMAASTSYLKQVATFLQSYAKDNRETIVPSQFDYTASAAAYPVKVRSDADLGPLQYRGTWCDILWTVNNMAAEGFTAPSTLPAPNQDDYLYDSPDQRVYQEDDSYTGNIFRSATDNSKTFPYNAPVAAPGPMCKPFGPGAQDAGLPGYFAANNFFNVDPGAPIAATLAPTWYTTGQIKAPERSMYLIDSFAGETIDPLPDPYLNDLTIPAPTLEVDFRYSGVCLMLMLDGHVNTEGEWTDICDLERGRNIRIRNLTNNNPPPGCP